MNLELLKRPRLLFTKLLAQYTRSHQSQRIKILMRNNLRKLCVSDELKIFTSQNFWMRASPKDYATYGIYFFGTYDPSMTAIFSHLVKPGETVWDVGTERGWFTLQLATLVGDSGRVDSFEAFPPTFDKLKINVDLNNMNWVNINCAAVSEFNSRMWFVPPSNKITNNISFLNDCSGVGYLTDKFEQDAIEVNAINLDDYYAKNNIQKVGLIKMDIEGAEVSALKGAKKLILKDKPVLAIEFNRQTALRANSSVEELNEILIAYGYRLFIFDKKFIPFNLSLYTSDDIVMNVYCFSS
jgi:FkbM family methyltransferase